MCTAASQKRLPRPRSDVESTSLQLQVQLSLRDELRAALSLLLVCQVRKFALNADALIDADVITANIAQSQAFTVSVKTTVDFSGADAVNDNLSYTWASEWLFLRAVEQKSYSLGIQFAKEERPRRRFSTSLESRPRVSSTTCMTLSRATSASDSSKTAWSSRIFRIGEIHLVADSTSYSVSPQSSSTPLWLPGLVVVHYRLRY